MCDHLLSLCDDTGLLQHAVLSIANREHGYCLDDNARALLLALGPNETPIDPRLVARGHTFCAFIQHAWNPENGQFRNFMDFGRRWMEDHGSEDSHGRALWALGEAAADRTHPSRADWAIGLFEIAAKKAADFTSPRAWAFTLLGLDGYCRGKIADQWFETLRQDLADRLLHLKKVVATPDWVWFEDGLAYDNARLPQALIVTGSALQARELIDTGLETLGWLVARQSNPSGQFRPVGSDSFGAHRTSPGAFDQQPLEAAATTATCLSAYLATQDANWRTEATRAFDWFHGANDLKLCLVDETDDGCFDGLHPDRINRNRGAESTLSFLLARRDLERFRLFALGDMTTPAI
jgi:hypothetical protein